MRHEAILNKIKSPSSERTKKESLLDVVATQQKRAHMAIINEQWKLVFQVAILIVGTRKFSLISRLIESSLPVVHTKRDVQRSWTDKIELDCPSEIKENSKWLYDLVSEF